MILMHFVLPPWLATRFAGWLCHRASDCGIGKNFQFTESHWLSTNSGCEKYGALATSTRPNGI